MIWGHYTVSGDTLTIKRGAWEDPESLQATGVYKFNRMGDQLHWLRL